MVMAVKPIMAVALAIAVAGAAAPVRGDGGGNGGGGAADTVVVRPPQGFISLPIAIEVIALTIWGGSTTLSSPPASPLSYASSPGLFNVPPPAASADDIRRSDIEVSEDVRRRELEIEELVKSGISREDAEVIFTTPVPYGAPHGAPPTPPPQNNDFGN